MKTSLFKTSALLVLLASHARAEYITLSTQQEFDQKVLRSEKPSIVKFGADWCGFCKAVKKPFENIAKDNEFAQIQFVHVNVDKAKDLSDTYNVGGIPTFIYFNHGNKVFEETGVNDMSKFKEHVRENVQKYFLKDGQTKVYSEVKTEELKESQTAKTAEQQKAEGFLDTIASIFKQIIDLIVNVIKYALDAIRGLFNK